MTTTTTRVLTNLSGTTSASFCIGKRGVSVISGSAEPLNSVGNKGDIYVLKADKPKFFQKHTTWVEVGTKNFQVITQSTMFETTYPEEVLLVDSSVDEVVVTLTTSSLRTGYVVIVKDAGGYASSHNITIETQGTETIDGRTEVIMDADYKSLMFFSDGSNWYLI